MNDCLDPLICRRDVLRALSLSNARAAAALSPARWQSRRTASTIAAFSTSHRPAGSPLRQGFGGGRNVRQPGQTQQDCESGRKCAALSSVRIVRGPMPRSVFR